MFGYNLVAYMTNMCFSYMNMNESFSIEDKVLSPSRRMFMKGAIAVAGVAVFDGWKSLETEQPGGNTDNVESPEDVNTNTGTQQPTDTSAPSSRNPLEEPISEYAEKLENETELSDTVEESLAMTGAVLGASILMNNKYAKLWTGNSGSQEIVDKYRKNKLKTASLVVVGAPVAEELIFRGLPAIGGTGMKPVRGIISTYLFGKIHQLKTKAPATNALGEVENKSQGVEWDQNRVPVPQYALGALYWMIARKRGVKHSTVAHATNNAVAISLLDVMSRFGKHGSEEIINK